MLLPPPPAQTCKGKVGRVLFSDKNHPSGCWGSKSGSLRFWGEAVLWQKSICLWVSRPGFWSQLCLKPTFNTLSPRFQQDCIMVPSNELGTWSTWTIIKCSGRYYWLSSNRNNPVKSCLAPPIKWFKQKTSELKRALKTQLAHKHSRLYENYPGDLRH